MDTYQLAKLSSNYAKCKDIIVEGEDEQKFFCTDDSDEEKNSSDSVEWKNNVFQESPCAPVILNSTKENTDIPKVVAIRRQTVYLYRRDLGLDKVQEEEEEEENAEIIRDLSLKRSFERNVRKARTKSGWLKYHLSQKMHACNLYFSSLVY